MRRQGLRVRVSVVPSFSNLKIADPRLMPKTSGIDSLDFRCTFEESEPLSLWNRQLSMYIDVKVRRHARENEGEEGRPAGIPIRKEDVQPAFSEMVRKNWWILRDMPRIQTNEKKPYQPNTMNKQLLQPQKKTFWGGNNYPDSHHLQGVWNLSHKFHLYLITIGCFWTLIFSQFFILWKTEA